MCPLFVSRVDGLLVFSTSVEGMLRHPSVPATINKLRLVDELRHTYPDPEETHYAAIRRIMPGHLMVSENGQVRLERYWDPLAGERVDWLTEAELDGFIDLFDQAVARCLQFGRAGVFLSGGLDSVSVAAVTADVSARAGMPAPLALSLRFPHPDVDESEIQRNVARQLGLPHVLLSVEEAVSGRGIFGAGLDMCRTWAAPLLNPWLPAYGSLFVESREQGCGVALTGGGGDEWLAVGPYLAADMVRTGDLRGLKFVWDTWGNSYRVSTVALLRSLWKFGFWPNLRDLAKRGISAAAPGALPRWARWRRSRSWPEWLAPGRQLRSQALDRARQESELVPTGGEKLRYYLADGRQALEHPMASMEMEEDFEMGRRLGVLEMDPYWDPDLVDFLYRTPPELLLRGGRGKGLVRWMLSERFPDLGFERQKKVTSTNYFLSMILEGAPDAWRRVGGVEALSDLGIIDGGAFQRAARDTIRERRPGGLQAVWEVLMMEAWLRGRL
jgi:asparagine synthetase B (glutamine-hydrolysing)